NPNNEMLDDISAASPKVPVVELRSLLGCFMFSGDDVFKPLGVLSGGERNRYAMAKMLVSPANMLLLDEPTNHLDLRAKDVLLDAIRNFSGTVLFVSHDRYFIDGLATRVFEVEDKRVHIYPGGYEDYLWRKQGGPEKVISSLKQEIRHEPKAEPAAVAEEAPAKADRPQAAVKRLNPIKLRQLEDRLRLAEEEIPRLETAIAAAEEKMAIFTSAEDAQRTAAELEQLRGQRAKVMAEWEELALMVEEQSLV
ncbi:MAG TPA: ATP-binding cassette domain-containing protein, partial [Edaphobacter sp.]|nr:ATP-binding cassette domain-containing protein [Edaphobacter sp.]